VGTASFAFSHPKIGGLQTPSPLGQATPGGGCSADIAPVALICLPSFGGGYPKIRSCEPIPGPSLEGREPHVVVMVTAAIG
jgi:hypothetical protein